MLLCLLFGAAGRMRVCGFCVYSCLEVWASCVRAIISDVAWPQPPVVLMSLGIHGATSDPPWRWELTSGLVGFSGHRLRTLPIAGRDHTNIVEQHLLTLARQPFLAACLVVNDLGLRFPCVTMVLNLSLHVLFAHAVCIYCPRASPPPLKRHFFDSGLRFACLGNTWLQAGELGLVAISRFFGFGWETIRKVTRFNSSLFCKVVLAVSLVL